MKRSLSATAIIGVVVLLVTTVAEELVVDILNLGSTTYKREDLMRGFEPDSSFYIRNLDRVVGKNTLDLTVDPPPDLVIEVDITNGSLDKLPIVAALGVPEVWRHDGSRLHILVLAAGTYHESERSGVLPPLTARVVSEFIAESRSLGSTAWLKKVRQWVKASGEPSRPV